MTTPVRNGVVVALNEYGEQRITDLYLPWGQNGPWVFRTSAGRVNSQTPHIIISRIEHWFDEHKDYGVLLADAAAVTVTPHGDEHIFGDGA